MFKDNPYATVEFDYINRAVPKVDEYGTKRWYGIYGQYHRLDGPAIECANGDKRWFINGRRHRTNGPAIENINGHKEWYNDGKCHRIDGPAMEFINGDKYWYIQGKLHRDDGPAVEKANGTKEWWLNGVKQLSPLITDEDDFCFSIDPPLYGFDIPLFVPIMDKVYSDQIKLAWQQMNEIIFAQIKASDATSALNNKNGGDLTIRAGSYAQPPAETITPFITQQADTDIPDWAGLDLGKGESYSTVQVVVDGQVVGMIELKLPQPTISAVTDLVSGVTCKKCNDFNQYCSSPSEPDGSHLCYKCRSGY